MRILAATDDTDDIADKAYVDAAVAPAASTTTAGKVELATAAETSTGTATGLAVTPDGLANSDFGTKAWAMALFDSSEDCATGNGTIGFAVPASMDAMNIVDVTAAVHTTGTTGTMDVQVRRRRAGSDVDVLSTKVTINSGAQFASDGVINTANDDLNEGDMIFCDVDAIHTTAAKGLTVTISARVA